MFRSSWAHATAVTTPLFFFFCQLHFSVARVGPLHRDTLSIPEDAPHYLDYISLISPRFPFLLFSLVFFCFFSLPRRVCHVGTRPCFFVCPVQYYETFLLLLYLHGYFLRADFMRWVSPSSSLNFCIAEAYDCVFVCASERGRRRDGESERWSDAHSQEEGGRETDA